MRRVAGACLLALALAACQGGATPAATEREVAEATRTAQVATALPTNPPTAPYLQDPNDPLTVVLGGEFANGGYWTWDDIANLLGVYAQYGAFVTATVEGQEFPGVPLSYLFDYARLNTNAQSIVVFNRDNLRASFTAAQLRRCADCLIARGADDSLLLILPSLNEQVIPNLVRIEAR